MPKNFVDYTNAQAIVTKIAQKLNEVNGAYVFRGTSAFASIPATPTAAQVGYVWDITDDFTTDARFVEGAGKKYPAHTNVAVADLSTYAAVTPVGSEDPSNEGWYEINAAGKYVLSTDTTVDGTKTYYAKTEVIKYDIAGSFIDVDSIEDRIDAIAADITGEFDATAAYAEGDIVMYEDGLYKFKTAHAAGAWDATEVDAITILELIEAAEPESLTTAQVNTLIGLLD